MKSSGRFMVKLSGIFRVLCKSRVCLLVSCRGPRLCVTSHRAGASVCTLCTWPIHSPREKCLNHLLVLLLHKLTAPGGSSQLPFMAIRSFTSLRRRTVGFRRLSCSAMVPDIVCPTQIGKRSEAPHSLTRQLHVFHTPS